MAEAKFYTYIHRKADTGEVFYVGKGCGRRAFSKVGRSQFWRNVVSAHGLITEIVRRFECEDEAFANEKELIAQFRASGTRLCNATDGGEGPSGAKRSDETRRLISLAMMGISKSPFSDEAKARMSASAKGRAMSSEAIEKTAAFHRGRKRSKETLERMSAALKGKGLGRKKSAEEIAKSAAARAGQFVSDETRKKISASHANRTKYCVMTDDHKAKILAGQAAYWERRRQDKAQSNSK